MEINSKFIIFQKELYKIINIYNILNRKTSESKN